MQAVILAGGRGERLRPLTDETPKPMIDVEGKPFLQYQMELLKRFKITEILLCVGYMAEVVQSYFRDGSQFGLNITYSIEGIPLKTGGAIKKAMRRLEDAFLLLNGDTYIPIDYADLITFSERIRSIGVMVVYDNKEIVTPNNVKVDEDGYVSFYSKRRSTKPNAVDAGVYVFRRDVIRFFPAKEIFSLEEEVFPKLIEAGELIGYKIDTRFYDIGIPERLKTFKDFIKARKL